MEERSICLFLALKWFSVRDVDNKLTTVLGSDAIASSTLTKYLRWRPFPSILDDPSDNHQRQLSIKQFLMPLRSGDSLLFASWLGSPAFQLRQSIDTRGNHLALS
jgi:hypothetical protein